MFTIPPFNNVNADQLDQIFQEAEKMKNIVNPPPPTPQDDRLGRTYIRSMFDTSPSRYTEKVQQWNKMSMPDYLKDVQAEKKRQREQNIEIQKGFQSLYTVTEQRKQERMAQLQQETARRQDMANRWNYMMMSPNDRYRTDYINLERQRVAFDYEQMNRPKEVNPLDRIEQELKIQKMRQDLTGGQYSPPPKPADIGGYTFIPNPTPDGKIDWQPVKVEEPYVEPNAPPAMEGFDVLPNIGAKGISGYRYSRKPNPPTPKEVLPKDFGLDLDNAAKALKASPERSIEIFNKLATEYGNNAAAMRIIDKMFSLNSKQEEMY